MSASLRSITTQIIGVIDEPFNYELYTRIKDVVLQELAALITSESKKSGIDEQWIQYALVDVVKVDPIDLQIGVSNKKIYRSVNKLPQNIRIAGTSPFVYVGTADRMVPYLYVTHYSMAIRMKNVEEIGDVPKYSIRNGYLEAYVNDANLKKLSVGHAWVMSGEISNETSTNIHVDHDDESELLISYDMIQLLKERVLKRDLSVVKPDDNVINVSSNEDIQNQ